MKNNLFKICLKLSIKIIQFFLMIVFIHLISAHLLNKEREVNLKNHFDDPKMLIQAIKSKDHGSLRIFIYNDNLDPNYVDGQNKKSVLNWAIEFENNELANYLIEKGANLNYQNKESLETSLHLIVKTQNIKLLKKVLEKKSKINLNLKNNANKTPLELANDINNEKIINLLTERN